MIVNFKARKISQGTLKLIRTPILIKKIQILEGTMRIKFLLNP
jgi:hypothetical protein